ncbi:DUF2167 domain-containing protein [Paenibacillus aurantius]|uniref:DUF2167 domain-containing protein n=1 Tax=Paenibacillus aurantius TaxID=2918900 RepID=A0AA96LGU5_9BACL|nr:DUF2167 domain-containing protein [Paenibacillus aurantius]WNQ11237.1 DUF2167 domain-containing protein [Paenibacillus aurantius]
MKNRRWRTKLGTGLLALLLAAGIPAGAYAAPADLNWVEGTGQTVPVGDNLAELKLGSDYVFLNGKDSQTFQKENGGTPSGTEIGSVFPKAEDQAWALFFEYEEPGHIADDEKDEIDAKALLKSYKDGTKEANEGKTEENKLYVDGWESEPKYDDKLHNLTWSILGHSGSNEKLVNYNVRLLTREGYISAVLVSDPEHLATSRQEMEAKVLNNFSVKAGQRYEDFDKSTDKMSKFGLTGLILGGAGLAVAKKVGLLALLLVGLKKFGVLIVVAVGWAWRFIRGKKKKPAEQPAGLSPEQLQQARPVDESPLAEPVQRAENGGAEAGSLQRMEQTEQTEQAEGMEQRLEKQEGPAASDGQPGGTTLPGSRSTTPPGSGA